MFVKRSVTHGWVCCWVVICTPLAHIITPPVAFYGISSVFEGVLTFVLLGFSGQNNPRIIADVLWAHGRVPVHLILNPGQANIDETHVSGQMRSRHGSIVRVGAALGEIIGPPSNMVKSTTITLHHCLASHNVHRRQC